MSETTPDRIGDIAARHSTPVTETPRPDEPPELRYLRETRDLLRGIRTATVTLAWIAVIGVLAGVITTIVIAVSIAHENAQLNGGSGTSSLCQSQGGPIAGC